MIEVATNSILVRCDKEQKSRLSIAGQDFLTPKQYSRSWRERTPVVCEVIQGTAEIPNGTFLLCSFTRFDENSPLWIQDDLYALPLDELIFASINEDGSLNPLFDNVFVERIMIPIPIKIPDDLEKPYFTQGYVAQDTVGFKKGQHIIWLPFSDYLNIYYWKGEEKTAIKVEKAEICGVIHY